VAAVQVSSQMNPTFVDPKLNTCMARVLRTMHFDGTTGVITYRFASLIH